MADGIRLHHPSERDCIWLVRHPRKDYYLRLDSEGDVIVSQTVYARLQEVSLAGLIFANVVHKPPKLIVGDAPSRRRRKITYDPHRQRIVSVEEVEA